MPGRAIHLASTLDPIASMIKAMAAGQSVSFQLDELDEMNARQAQDYAGCTKAETIELLTSGLLIHIDEHFGSIRKTVGLAGKEARS
jgi:hypothetical protein